MLIRFLYLSAIWFAFSLLFMLARGARWQRGSWFFSFLWLVFIIALGDVVAWLTFGIPQEILYFSLIGLIFGQIWIIRLRDWNAAGQVTWSMTLLTTLLFIIYAFMLTAFTPLNPLSFIFAVAFFFFESITLFLALAHMYESLDVVCRVRWHRLRTQLDPVPGYAPMVSLHVPAYNEPLDVMERTLHSLAALDYPNYEVLVVDNNTPTEEAWRPLETLCRYLGPRFHYLHLEKWPGYKSGALNFAVTQTDPRAEIIGIIDADYQVDPAFLRALTPAFADPSVAFVQTPQDYIDQRHDTFSESTYRGYKYFFEVSMPARNERNAIIFAGTMGLIRRSVLEEIGGWDEWCITEDAEASLRILKKGYQSLYINRAFGSGLMPLDFEGLKKQRFRWCFGGIQILKKHWEALMPWARWVDPSNKLTMAQRYYYLLGGLGWFTDLLNLVFALFLVLGAVFSLLNSPVQIRPLTNTILIIPAAFLFLHLLRFIWVLRNRLHISLRMAIATMYNFFSLGWAVSLACVQGLIQKEGTFLRTPKAKGASRLGHAITATQWETAIGLICVTAGVLAFITNPNWRIFALGVLLAWQASLYLAAPAFSLMSLGKVPGGAAPAIEQTQPVREQGRPIPERSAARWLLVFSLTMLIAFTILRFLPTPIELPSYARFFPGDIQIPQLVGQAPPPVPGQAYATVGVANTGCFEGPGKQYDRASVLHLGESYPIIGRTAKKTNPWLFVQLTNGNGCWVWTKAATITGPFDEVPVIEQ